MFMLMLLPVFASPAFAAQSNITAPSQTSQSNLTESLLIATNEIDYVRIVVNLLASSSSPSSALSPSSPRLSEDSTDRGVGVDVGVDVGVHQDKGISLVELRRSLCQSDPTTHSGMYDRTLSLCTL